MSVTDRELVFVAKIAPGPVIWSSLANNSALSCSRSGIASMTRSAPARSANSQVKVMRPSRLSCSSSVSFPRLTARLVEPTTLDRPCSRDSGFISTATTLNPLRAITSAMPAPMVPRPITATVPMFNMCESSHWLKIAADWDRRLL